MRHRLPRLQVALELVHPAGIGIFLRRNAERCLEGALEVEGAHTEGVTKSVEGDRFVKMALDIAADRANIHGASIGCSLNVRAICRYIERHLDEPISLNA